MNNNLWKKYNLEELYFFQEGPGLRNYQFTKTGIKFLNIRCIQDGIIKLEKAPEATIKQKLS